MKILSYFLLALMLYSTEVMAQDPDEQRFRATIVAGLNASQIDGDQTAGYNKLGLNLGARGGVIFSKRWELGFEILFSQQGAQSPFIKGQPRDFICHLNYIEVPVIMYFKDWSITNDDNKTYQRFWFGLGASYNRLMGGKLLDPSGFVIRGGDLFTMTNPFFKNHVMLMADVNFFFTRNWGINIRYERAPMNIREQKLFNPHMIVFRALFTF